MQIETLLIIIWLHFFADFLLQTRWMGRNKSKSNFALFVHVAVYSIPFLWFGWKYAVVNGMAHFATDWISSRFGGKMYAAKKEFFFWAVIGADQAIHLTALIATFGWLAIDA